MTYRKAPPCDVCRRCHRGPRCKPEASRSVSVTLTLPRPTWHALTEQVPWGDRSSYVAHLLDQALDVPSTHDQAQGPPP